MIVSARRLGPRPAAGRPIGSLLLVACVAYLDGRSIVAALDRLVGAASAIAGGRLRRARAGAGPRRVRQLGRAFNEMADQLEARLDELEDERGRLREATARFGDALAATHDPSSSGA